MANLWGKAKAFIGLEEEEVAEKNEGEKAQVDPLKSQEKERVVKFKSMRKPINTEGLEIAVFEPKVYEESLGVSTHLRQGNPVVINLKYLDPTEGTRLIDFVCGAAYAIDGHMLRIGESIFLFTPGNISIADIAGRAPQEQGLESKEKGDFLGNRL